MKISELLVATAESSDPLLDDTVFELLRATRLRMQMDGVFVSEFVEGRRVFRYVDAAPGAPALEPGASSPAEETVCRRVVEGRIPERVRNLSALPVDQLPPLPFRIGAHLSTPIVMKDKRLYGTLCCFSAAPRPELVQADLDKLRMCATLVARKAELSEARGPQSPPPGWKPQARDEVDSPVWRSAARRQDVG